MAEKIAESLAVVLPRYGKSLGGGAETLTRLIAEDLLRAGLIGRLEVWTTCAMDHRTWANALPEGESVEDGILVRRFPVDGRDIDLFLRAEFAMRDGRSLTVDEQLDWLRESVNSRALYQHIAREGRNFDAILFAPYLFGTSFWGPLIHPDRSILIPCLHDEHYAYQDVFRALFLKVRGLIFNAEPERRLASELYGEDFQEKSAVIGLGFEPVQLTDPSETLARFAVRRPYLLYSGRKEQGKNLDLLIDFYSSLSEWSDRPELILIGSGEVSFLEKLPEGVRDLGFVSEEEKGELMRGALALCQPSTNESYSIVVMEALLRETPVLVHTHCAVTRDHVIRSGGGLYFENRVEFRAVIERLMSGLRDTFGRSGREWVEREYSWEAVRARIAALFNKLEIQSQKAPGVASPEFEQELRYEICR